MITGVQIKEARKLLGWHRGMVAIRGRGITGNTVGKAEGAYPGKPPTPEQLAEIKAVLEAAGIEFTNGDEPGVKLKATKAGKAKRATSRFHRRPARWSSASSPFTFGRLSTERGLRRLPTETVLA